VLRLLYDYKVPFQPSSQLNSRYKRIYTVNRYFRRAVPTVSIVPALPFFPNGQLAHTLTITPANTGKEEHAHYATGCTDGNA